MYTIKGIITKIEEVKTELSHKNLVTLQQFDNHICFIEFRGKVMMQILKPYQNEDQVSIDYEIEGKISKKTQMHYNNLVARSIKNL